MSSAEWSSRSLGSRFKHEIFYMLIRRFGLRAAYLLLYPTVAWYTLKILFVRGVYPYILRRFPDAGPLRRLSYCFRLNMAFGRTLADRAALGLTGRAEFRSPPGAAETLGGLLAEGRGLVILTAHAGAWQTGLAWLEGLERPLNVVLLKEEADNDRHYFEHAPRSAAPKIIDSAQPAPALAAAAAAVLRGEIVAFMADRARPEEKMRLKAPFLGAGMNLPGGPFFLAARLGAPLAVALSWRSGPGRTEGRLFKIIRPADAPAAGAVRASTVRASQDLQPLADAFAEALTEFVTEQPFQFFNFHDLWSD